MASKVPFNPKIQCWSWTSFIFSKVLSHTFSKFYFLLSEGPGASYMFFGASGERRLMGSVLSTSRTPGTVLQGRNSIRWYSAERKTQRHKTKERDCGYGLWFLGENVFCRWRESSWAIFLTSLQSPCSPPPCSPAPGTSTEKGHAVTGQLWLRRCLLTSA